MLVWVFSRGYLTIYNQCPSMVSNVLKAYTARAVMAMLYKVVWHPLYLSYSSWVW